MPTVIKKYPQVIVGALAVLAVVLLGVFVFLSNSDKSGNSSTAVPQPTGTENVTDFAITDHGYRIGDPDAPHTVTIYEEMQCPHCKELHDGTKEELTAALAEGDVQVEYVIMNFINPSSPGEFSARASNLLAVLAENSPEAWYDVHSALFEVQPDMSKPGDSLSDDDLIVLAENNGAVLDGESTQQIRDRVWDDWNDANNAWAQEQGIQSTPTVILDGEEQPDASLPEGFNAMLSNL